MYRETDRAGILSGVEGILEHLRVERPALPKDLRAIEDVADFLNEETDLILLPVTLEGDWYRHTAGPFLACDQAGAGLALLPDWRGRYYFRDGATGRRIYLNGKNCPRFSAAYSVTLDCPDASLGGLTLLRRMLRETAWYEGGLLALWGLLGGVFGALLAEQVRGVLSGVLLTADQRLFWKGMVSVVLLALLETALVLGGRRICDRVAQKAALSAIVCIGGRLYAGEHLDAPDGVPQRMAALRGNAERVMGWLLTGAWGVLAAAVMLAALWRQSPEGSLAGASAALVLYAAAAAVFLVKSRRPAAVVGDLDRREWLISQAADRQLGIERPFPKELPRGTGKVRMKTACPVIALLDIPMLYLAMDGGYSAARLAQTALLYSAAAALAVFFFLESGGAGRSMADMRALLPLAKRPERGNVPLPPKGSVFELKDVTFSYPGQEGPLLRQINLRLRPGERVGILGATGSGKTTLVRLMTGLADPTSGGIYYGGIEIMRFSGRGLRRRVAWETGADILLCGRVPGQRDGRTCVVFAAREEALAGCDRILRLADGQLR